jgi:hypothetical protein
MYSPFLACLSHTIYAKPFVWAAHLFNNNILKVWLSPKEKKCYTGYRKNRWLGALVKPLVEALAKVLVKVRAEMQVKALAKTLSAGCSVEAGGSGPAGGSVAA